MVHPLLGLLPNTMVQKGKPPGTPKITFFFSIEFLLFQKINVFWVRGKKNPRTEIKFDPGISLFYPQDLAANLSHDDFALCSDRSSDFPAPSTSFPFRLYETVAHLG